MSLINPTVSVLLPYRNAENTLRDAIRSILGQSFTDFEVLLVDNQSDDEGARIAREMAELDPRIVLLHEPEVGIVHALRRGLSLARAPFIARMDADDISYPERLEVQYRFLAENPETGLVASQVDFEGNTEAKGIQAYVDWSNRLLSQQQIQLNRFVDAPLVHPSVMFRIKLLKAHGSYQQGDFPEDFELWLRWMEAGVGFEKIARPLLCWQDHPGRLTRGSERYRPEAFYRIKALYLNRWLQAHNPFYPEVVIWGAGRKSRQRSAMLEDQGCQIKAYIDIKADKTSTRPCIYYREIAAPGQYFVLSYVANQGQREKIRKFLMGKGYVEGVHFLLAA